MLKPHEQIVQLDDRVFFQILDTSKANSCCDAGYVTHQARLMTFNDEPSTDRVRLFDLITFKCCT